MANLLQKINQQVASISSQASVTHSIDALYGWCENEMHKVNKVILGHLSDIQVPLITEMATYLIEAGGKRLRPLLTIACAKMAGYEGDRHIELAACVEFIHTATLLHDDVIDEAPERRGNISANFRWGNQASILVGDFLFSRAFELMVADGNLPVLKLLSATASEIAEGEVLQLSALGDIEISEDLYFKIIKAKTAALFRAACGIGGIIAKREPVIVQALETYGENLGIAFQLIDDVLDYEGAAAGDDFRKGNITLPLMLLYEIASSQEKTILSKALKEVDFQLVKALLKKYDICQQVRQRASLYIDNAINALSGLGLRKKHLLKDLAIFCSLRTN